jgi:molybdopterin-binding protein
MQRRKELVFAMAVRFSARNQLRGTVKSIKFGEVMAEIVVELPDGQQIVSAITRTSAESLGLKQGSSVLAIVKSTEVMIGINE